MPGKTTKVAFIGSKGLGLSALNKMTELAPEALHVIITCEDSGDSRSILRDMLASADAVGKPCHVLEKPSALGVVLEREKPDLCLVVGWYWKIPPQVMEKVPLGFVGMHGSLLPKYRGHAPLVWSILNGEKEGGVSFFYMDEGLDTGDIVGQQPFTIGPDETIADILGKTEMALKNLLEQHYVRLLEGKAERTVQNTAGASYCGLRRPEDGRIRWELDAEAIHNAIRAQTNPYPGAYCLTGDGGKIHIWKSRIYPSPYYGVPGTVAEVGPEQVLISCGKGALYVLKATSESGLAGTLTGLFHYGMRLC